MELVNAKTVVHIIGSTVLSYPVVFPNLHAFLSIQAKQATVVSHKHRFATIVGHHQETVIWVYLIGTIAQLERLLFLCKRIVAIDAFVVELHPEILFGIDEDSLYTVIKAEILL